MKWTNKYLWAYQTDVILFFIQEMLSGLIFISFTPFIYTNLKKKSIKYLFALHGMIRVKCPIVLLASMNQNQAHCLTHGGLKINDECANTKMDQMVFFFKKWIYNQTRGVRKFKSSIAISLFKLITNLLEVFLNIIKNENILFCTLGTLLY